MSIRRFWEALKVEKSYLLFSVILFLSSCLYGVLFWDQVQQVLKDAGIMEQLLKITKKIAKEPTFTNIFSTIFFNNLFVTITAIISGVVFGIYPILIVVNNGMLLSAMVMGSASITKVHPLVLFVTTVLPHGIFELPAILIGAAFGIHLGMAVLRLFISFFTRKVENVVEEWRGIRNRFVVIVMGIAVFLLCAAIIETGLILLMRSLQ